MGSEKLEEYLESIYKLHSEHRHVGISQLAENLKLTPASVTEMISKLVEKKLAIKTEKKNIKLTEKGEKQAVELIRRHRLVERFFTDFLKLKWETVHEDACKFEHVLTKEISDALEQFMNHPTTCPHGHPIPDVKGKTAKQDAKPLTSLKPAQSGVIARIAEESREFLKYLATLGLIPQIVIKVEQIAPFNGPYLIKVGNSSYALGREVASKIWVREVTG
ncbi:MAG: metal-dependent transcriptional regulator [Firmicutes bacterium]|nr:metal-dependent transcriptional regulator [Bacillota bacterium]